MSLHEAKRIKFIIHRDGVQSALEFAERTKKIYRKSVLKRGGHNKAFHHASISPYRRMYIESYLFLKTFADVRDYQDW